MAMWNRSALCEDPIGFPTPLRVPSVGYSARVELYALRERSRVRHRIQSSEPTTTDSRTSIRRKLFKSTRMGGRYYKVEPCPIAFFFDWWPVLHAHHPNPQIPSWIHKVRFTLTSLCFVAAVFQYTPRAPYSGARFGWPLEAAGARSASNSLSRLFWTNHGKPVLNL